MALRPRGKKVDRPPDLEDLPPGGKQSGTHPTMDPTNTLSAWDILFTEELSVTEMRGDLGDTLRSTQAFNSQQTIQYTEAGRWRHQRRGSIVMTEGDHRNNFDENTGTPWSHQILEDGTRYLCIRARLRSNYPYSFTDYAVDDIVSLATPVDRDRPYILYGLRGAVDWRQDDAEDDIQLPRTECRLLQPGDTAEGLVRSPLRLLVIE